MLRNFLCVMLACMAGTTPAMAQMVCGNHADVERRLQTGYKEVRTGVGLAGNGGLIELYTSEKGTFTIVFTRPNGLSCLMAVGEGWEAVKEPTPAHWTLSPDRPDLPSQGRG